MRAYALHGIDDLRLEETALPEIKEREVLVKVMAAGICGSDIPRIYKTGTYSYPLIPGHEFSGTVIETGLEADKKWMGKRVGIFPLIPCGECEPCRKKQYEMCRHYSYLGSRTNGGFAEYAAVPEDNLIELPEEVGYEAAAMLEPMAVAVHAMRKSGVTKENTVVVYGLGTIGLLLCMFLLDAGVRDIYVIGNKEFQKKMAGSLGIAETHYCDSKSQEISEWLQEQTGGRGVDVFFECVGKNETIADAIGNTVPGGTVQMVGNPASDIMLKKEIYWKILRNQLSVKGSWNSSFLHNEGDDWHYVLDKLDRQTIHPEQFITQKFEFEHLKDGLEIMRDKREEYVKVMMVQKETGM